MTQVDPTTDPAPTDPAQPDAAELSRRERAAQEAKTRELELTNLMLRAGIDPESKEAPVNALFFKGYEGELTSEAVLEAAKSYGLVKDPVPDPTPTGDITDPAERSQSLDRQQAAQGTIPDGNAPTEDPRVAAVKAGQAEMDRGGTEESAVGAAFDVIAAAGWGSQVDGRRPDSRAQFDGTVKYPDLGW